MKSIEICPFIFEKNNKLLEPYPGLVNDLYFLHAHCISICTSSIFELLLSVHDEGYSRNVSCALNLISTFLFLYRK